MIIMPPLFSLKRMAGTTRKNYVKFNVSYESCNGVRPSAKIKTKNAVKALSLTLATEITKLTII